MGSEGAVEGEAVGKSMEELTNEKEKELDEKMKNSDGSIKYAKPGRSDILP